VLHYPEEQRVEALHTAAIADARVVWRVTGAAPVVPRRVGLLPARVGYEMPVVMTSTFRTVTVQRNPAQLHRRAVNTRRI
jgi:hypothetical protein